MLRGRAGRQGDPGYSKFFLSLEDDLLRLFISDSRRGLFERIGMGDDHIEHKMLSRGIENAQKRIENRNFDLRKNLLEYDDVANDQRQAVYQLRDQLLFEDEISNSINELIEDEFTAISYDAVPPESVETQWKLEELEEELRSGFKLNLSLADKVKNDRSILPKDIAFCVADEASKFYKSKYAHIGDNLKMLEKQVMLQVLDNHWKDHLAEMDHLRQNIGLRAYAQKNPKNEYKREAYEMFEDMLQTINIETVKVLFSLELVSEEEINELKEKALEEQKRQQSLSSENQPTLQPPSIDQNISSEPQEPKAPQTIQRNTPKLGRNDPCHCGSGKKFKHCCGK